MAIAVEALPGAAEAAEGAEGSAAATRAAAAAPASRPRSSGGDWLNTGQSAYSRVSTPSATMQTIGRLIWAAALGIIVLEIAAQATGQTWHLNLGQQSGAVKPVKQPYRPLYAGQQQLPEFVGMIPTQTAQTNLSGRAGGNLAAP